VGQPGGPAAAHNFWLLFVGLNIVAAVGLVLYDRIFGKDTERTRALARKVMIAIYALLLAAGVLFLRSGLSGAELSYKILVQATIMLLLGAGGMIVSLKKGSSGNSGEG
jgi:hypothetical protein